MTLPLRAATLIASCALAVAGCGGSLDTYETKDGAATRLDGADVVTRASSIGDVVRRKPTGVVEVQGYLFAPHDEVDRLCTRLEPGRSTCRAPSLVLDTGNVDLYAYVDSQGALEAGCCAIGYWSPTEVVVRLRLERGKTPVLLA